MKTTIARKNPKLAQAWANEIIGEFLYISPENRDGAGINMLIACFTPLPESDVDAMLDCVIYNPFSL